MVLKDLKDEFLHDYTFRTFFTSTLSFLATIAMIIYNIYLGFRYEVTYSFYIGGYYAVLIIIRGIILISEKILNRKEKKEDARRIIFFVTSGFVMVLDLALCAPVTLMVLNEKAVNFGLIPAIAFAAYTTYKIVLAIYNYKKRRRDENLALRELKLISLIDALASLLSLQHALIIVNSADGVIEQDMLILSAVSSFLIIGVIVVLSLVSFLRVARGGKNESV